MNPISTIASTRRFLIDLVKDLSTDQLNEIPQGFNNNIAWNMGHLISAQLGVCYRRAGLDDRIDMALFEAYKPGSKPEAHIGAEEIERIKELLLSSLTKLEEDVNNNVFKGYTPWETRYGVPINSAEDGIGFLVYHEGLHTGYVMALKRLVSKPQ